MLRCLIYQLQLWYNIYLFFLLDSERYYNRIHLIFLEKNPDVKSFDIYRPSWEFLKSSAKFSTIIAATGLANKFLVKKGEHQIACWALKLVTGLQLQDP